MIELYCLLVASISLILTIIFALPYAGLIYILFYVLLFVAYFILAFALYALLFYLGSKTINLKEDYTKPAKFRRIFMYLTTFMVLRVCRVKVKKENFDMLPKEPFLLIQNHRSGFDPLVTMDAFKRVDHIAFISKKENLNIPFAGPYMHSSCFYCIDRDDPKKAIKTLGLATKLITNEHINVGVYPEGTRNKTDATLLEFRDGCFKIATKAKCPIVVTVQTRITKGVKYPFRKHICTVKVIKVLTYDDYKDLTTVDIGRLTSALMKEELEKEKTA